MRPKIWDEDFTFCFVRNPWDRMVSEYLWKRTKKFSNFDEFVNFSFHNKKIEYPLHKNKLPSQYRYVTDDKGKVIVDFVGRFENLQVDFNKVKKIVKLPEGELGHEKKKENRTYKDYREYYTPKTKEMIMKICKEDIEMFDYCF